MYVCIYAAPFGGWMDGKETVRAGVLERFSSCNACLSWIGLDWIWLDFEESASPLTIDNRHHGPRGAILHACTSRTGWRAG